MDHRSRVVIACAGIVGMFLAVQIGALAMVEPFQEQGHQFVEDTGDPTISVLYVGAIVVVTGLMLVALRYGGDAVLRAIIVFAGAYIGFFVFEAILPAWIVLPVGGMAVDLIAVVAATLLGLSLYLYPEWYVVDAAGIVMGIGGAGLFGINFGILPAIVLLVVLAVYDAISVYGTEHMLTLASGVMEMRVPVVLVIPLKTSYSFLESATPETISDESQESSEGPEDVAVPGPEELEELGPEGIESLDEELLEQLDESVIDELDGEVREAIEDALPGRDALFIGLGDAVIPAVLVASAAVFVSGPTVSLLGITATVPAVGAMIGTIAGLIVLLWMVMQGRAHAGLPLLNSGAIAGYLIAAVLSGITVLDALGVSGFL